MPRYIVTEPVEGGTAYYDVRDTQSPEGQNFSLLTIFKGLPDGFDPKTMAEQLCASFNQGSKC